LGQPNGRPFSPTSDWQSSNHGQQRRGQRDAATTFLDASSKVFVDSAACGYLDLRRGWIPDVGDWVQLNLTKTTANRSRSRSPTRPAAPDHSIWPSTLLAD